MNLLGPFANGQEARESNSGALSSELLCQLLVRQVDEYAIYLLDLAGRALTWNEGVARLFGYSEHEFIGSPVELFFLPDDVAADRPRRELELARTHGVHQSSRWLRRKDGSSFCASCYTKQLQDGNGEAIAFAKVLREYSGKAKSYLASLAEHSPAAIIGVSVSGLVEFWNTSAEAALGYTAAEIVGLHTEMLSPVELREAHRQLNRRVLAGEVLREETQLLHRDGQRVWVVVSSGPVIGENGDITGISVGLLDIRARKAYEEQLRVTERRHRFLMKLGDRLRGCTRPEEIKAAACELLGRELAASRVYYAHYESDQDHVQIQHDYHDGVPSLAGRWCIEDFGSTIAGSLLEGHTVVVNDSATDAFLEEHVRSTCIAQRLIAFVDVPLIRHGKLVTMMGALQAAPRDWTASEIALVENTAERTWEALERAKAETLLRESEDRLRRALRIETVGVVHFSPEGRIVDANEAFLRMTGFADADVRRGDLNWHSLTTPEFLAASQSAIDELNALGHSTPYEKQYFHQDGTRRWGLFAATLLPDGSGVEFIIDVTKRRELEASLREADRRKDEFLATLGHELRNPLAPIRHGLEIARITARDDSVLMETIDRMDRQFAHLVRLVDDLLDLGRISAGKIILRRNILNVNELILTSVDATRATIDTRQHTLDFTLADEELFVDGDIDRLSQVIFNLLSNAAKYTPEGGRIQVHATRDGTEVVIAVADSGIGIPGSELARVFDLFSQVRQHQGRAEGGLGIGLSIVKSLVAMHGGSVEATSPGANAGSKFIVRLPLCEARAGLPHSPSNTTEETSSRPRRIVVADDNRDAVLSLAVLLELQGHEVATAYDGVEAVEQVRTTQPDVVILDVGMPNMNGLEAARMIRSLPGGERIALLALTGWGQETDRLRTQEAGFDGHLVKPVSSATLAEMLARVDERR